MNSFSKFISISLIIFLGGALGTLFRWGIHLTTDSYLFPVGTVIENISGSFLLGLLAGWAAIKTIPLFVKEGAGTGFCGGFTTMSTFAADHLFLLKQAGVYYAATYFSFSLAGGIIAAVLGMKAGEKLARKRSGGET
ncbi:fluoride efflux transporter FluC [Salisediminibacterium halotolerans]|uniref:fluoride efflux transporter FluC n=1 Tax=Salisediminibacterium halotolerans TaxID=517425 RepID=UPI000F1739E9|nr:CrcB family protein [Salisediminibacterium halotolerans]RLJ73266.1 CrcB protein [Actinophytocola xinjiangensis]RPE86688.1 CrcB protein [Salisediminibacterium halotolerans]TWG34063.1 CrcB protein [Salisediminibacterium halotolerans]GEL08910.1 putative fluoride ion transporter CrcB 2 [Salisediminibacterium halotolerans]